MGQIRIVGSGLGGVCLCVGGGALFSMFIDTCTIAIMSDFAMMAVSSQADAGIKMGGNSSWYSLFNELTLH